MKKALSLLIAVAMLGSMIIGCGPKEDTKAPETTKAEADGTQAEEPDAELPATKAGLTVTDKELTIVMWDIATDDPLKSIMEEAVARFEADYPNITVDQVHAQNDTYKQNLLVAMSAKQCPDMYMHWTGGPMAEYYESGFCNDITDLVTNHSSVKYFPSAIAQCSYDDKVLAVSYHGFSGSGFYYNTTIFEDLGLEAPTTIAEMENCAKVLKENGYIPFVLANQNQWTGSMYFMNLVARYSANAEFDAAYMQKDGGSFTSKAFIKAAEKVQEWVENGWFPEGVNSLNTDDKQDVQLMVQGKGGMMLHGTWMSGTLKNNSPEGWYEENIDFFPFPKDEESEAAGIDQSLCIGTGIDNAFSFNCWNEDGTVDEEKLTAAYVLATCYITDDEYTLRNIKENGKMPCYEGWTEYITDHTLQKVAKAFNEASSVQLWYDQYLPASVTEVHKANMSDLFGLTKTPQEIGEAHDAAMKEYWESK